MSVDAFESLIGSITAQQVNLTWALTTRRRLVESFGVPVGFGDVVVWRFPDPEPIAASSPEVFRAMQFTTRKSEFIVDLAKAAVAGTLDGLAELSNEAVIERLTAIRGIGRWSAEWLLARQLARPDVVAAGDLGVRKAISRFVVHTDDVIPEADVRAVTDSWGDGANWGTHLLLEALAE
jgi:DNA-3-methyladenine glycosylase II